MRQWQDQALHAASTTAATMPCLSTPCLPTRPLAHRFDRVKVEPTAAAARDAYLAAITGASYRGTAGQGRRSREREEGGRTACGILVILESWSCTTKKNSSCSYNMPIVKPPTGEPAFLGR